MLRRARMLGVVGFLLAGGVGIISSTQTWLTVRRTDGAEPLLVAGADALPLLAPLSLAVLALGAALSIAGRALRYAFAVLAAAGAITLGIGTVSMLVAPPLSAVAPGLSAATGLSGERTLEALIAGTDPTAWPAIAAVGWIVLLAASVLVLVTAHRWGAGGRRYDSASRSDRPRSGPLDPIDSWDELSHGTDPTGPSR